MKNKAMMMVIAVEHQALIPHLLRCDIEKVKSVLASYEQDGGKVNLVIALFPPV